MKLKGEEEYLHIACFTWVKLNEKQFPCLKLAFHPANGGSRNIIEATKLKKMGVRPGVPDFMLPVRVVEVWNGLAIEFKSKNGTTSEIQEEYISGLLRCGWCVRVVRDFHTFVDIVTDYCKRVNLYYL
jgi:hypothetical protein